MATPIPDTDVNLDDYFGPLDPVWAPPTPPAGGPPVVVVPVHKLYADPLYGKYRGVALDQGAPAWLQLVLYSPQTGAPLAISIGQYSTPPTVQVRYREGSGFDPRTMDPDPGDTPTLAPDGRSVVLPVPQQVKDCPAVYSVQARVLDGNGVEAVRGEFALLVQRGLWMSDGAAPSDTGPPTVAEVRTALRDHPAANRLLGNYNFDGGEVAQALVAAVQMFATEPPIGPQRWTTATFPAAWRRQWLDGTLAYLCETFANYARAGHLPYSAAGLSIDDLGKEKDFLGAAAFYRQRYERWVKLTKARISVASAWGSLGSGLGSSVFGDGWRGGGW